MFWKCFFHILFRLILSMRLTRTMLSVLWLFDPLFKIYEYFFLSNFLWFTTDNDRNQFDWKIEEKERETNSASVKQLIVCKLRITDKIQRNSADIVTTEHVHNKHFIFMVLTLKTHIIYMLTLCTYFTNTFPYNSIDKLELS